VKGIKHTLSSQMEQRILNAWSSWVQRRISWPQGTVLYGHFLVQKESYPVVIFCPKRTVPGGQKGPSPVAQGTKRDRPRWYTKRFF